MILEKIFLQLLMVLFPLLVHQIIIRRKLLKKWLRQTTFVLFYLIATFLTMSYGIELTAGYFIDLRFVPVILAFIFGSFHKGINVAVGMVLLRALFGGEDALLTLLVTPFLMIALYWILYKRRLVLKRDSSLYPVGLVLYTFSIQIILDIIIISPVFTPEWILHYSISLFINIVTIWLIIQIYDSITENEKLSFEVQRTERLNTMAQLAASVAHEIRNPMTTVKGFMQLLLAKQDIPTEDKQFIKISLDELQRANDILNDYLSLARQPLSENMEHIDLNKEIDHVLNSMYAFASLHDISINVEKTASPLIVQAQSEKIRQILLNIIKNAIEAVPTKKGVVKISLFSSQQNAIIQIEDNGIGISKTDLSKLGQPFFSTKQDGTGLGLMVCYNIIKLFGGKIDVQSKLGVGTTFIIQLPLVK
ncbi:GHKL domain-containing protein [Bacillus sp. HMF5848]|uniref:ATP-binding protein n=1 Tax=Bacillus sp. HMF5848 TaxID=2495421 RepID=UPI000F778592|nr:ATP-binding protein [Bacillus sp. HMF5848]RSK29016.1 GHKL domain-containing protein [Bacillus sp. HMF5848]